MTREEFEQRYAARSGQSIEALRAYGYRSAPCTCEEPDCEGWKMLHGDALADRVDELEAELAKAIEQRDGVAAKYASALATIEELRDRLAAIATEEHAALLDDAAQEIDGDEPSTWEYERRLRDEVNALAAQLREAIAP